MVNFTGCGQFYWVWLVKCGCEMCSCMYIIMSTKQLVVTEGQGRVNIGQAMAPLATDLHAH